MSDVYAYLQSRVEVTRPTIFRILRQTGRYAELLVNPQLFLDYVVGAIRRTLNRLLVAGVKHERLAGQEYAMHLFEDEEATQYLGRLYEVQHPGRTLYNYVPVDSHTEKSFAASCDAAEKVRFFKLPQGFLIPTPLGQYRPDWAIVLDGEQRVYFVVETKDPAGPAGPIDQQRLRGTEKLKIRCGTAHFAAPAPLGMEYQVKADLRDVGG